MASTESTTLPLTARAPEGSRSARRLRRDNQVPGVIYGGGDEPQHFAVDARTLRNTLARAAQVIEITVDGGSTANVLIKDVGHLSIMLAPSLTRSIVEQLETAVALERAA